MAKFQTPSPSGQNAPRGLDHLVIGVRDLDLAGDVYARLGFTVGKRNSHPWGTQNRIIQFPGAFLELIAIADAGRIPEHGAGIFSFGAFVRDALTRGEGLSMAVLESQDAVADAARFRALDIGAFAPFSFERIGVNAAGVAARVAFTLAFAADPLATDCGFFVCQQHEPQNFWNPAAQRHENGAVSLEAALMIAENPTDHHIFLSGFTGQRALHSSSLGISAPLPRGRFDILTPRAGASLLGDPAMADDESARFAGFAVGVPDLAALKRRLTADQIAFVETPRRIIVPAAINHGAAIAFEQV